MSQRSFLHCIALLSLARLNSITHRTRADRPWASGRGTRTIARNYAYRSKQRQEKKRRITRSFAFVHKHSPRKRQFFELDPSVSVGVIQIDAIQIAHHRRCNAPIAQVIVHFCAEKKRVYKHGKNTEWERNGNVQRIPVISLLAILFNFCTAWIYEISASKLCIPWSV